VVAFFEEAERPAGVRGPVEDWALMALAVSCAGVVDIGCSPGFRIDRLSTVFGPVEGRFVARNGNRV
jgi:hypothetical protein